MHGHVNGMEPISLTAHGVGEAILGTHTNGFCQRGGE